MLSATVSTISLHGRYQASTRGTTNWPGLLLRTSAHSYPYHTSLGLQATTFTIGIELRLPFIRFELLESSRSTRITPSLCIVQRHSGPRCRIYFTESRHPNVVLCLRLDLRAPSCCCLLLLFEMHIPTATSFSLPYKRMPAGCQKPNLFLPLHLCSENSVSPKCCSSPKESRMPKDNQMPCHAMRTRVMCSIYTARLEMAHCVETRSLKMTVGKADKARGW
ncbi:uncharacterized protein B0I36DRAFT_89022 [Microdochium trichocladiopsis]|uniref:Uncharacterized protein n=1 Tax=Microdochium trichocladiopsis TaxID=1682393 RepID=A0A9P8YAZ1_9PEZI|nr:uncharacterized protein B0I36DRAFT_89022 [Microdochium trichocladiopsis]KAH7035168.1 hypothetical protein B0I36DRAFT_89022 [Microdochium trichocladiopsis]